VKEAGAAAGAEEISRIDGALDVRERVSSRICSVKSISSLCKTKSKRFLESREISKTGGGDCPPPVFQLAT
jgi:hypothetical protein